MKKIEFKIIDNRIGTQWPLPTYHSTGAAGMDLRACITDPITLMPHESKLVSAGFAMHIADSSIAALIIPRSGSGNAGLVVGNLTGLIDSDYQGLISVSCWNRTDHAIRIEPGERVAQMVFVPVIMAQFDMVTEFTERTERGSGGFGSTGSS